jgi:hypothetical protein
MRRLSDSFLIEASVQSFVLNSALGSPACFQRHRRLLIGNHSPPKRLVKAWASSGFALDLGAVRHLWHPESRAGLHRARPQEGKQADTVDASGDRGGFTRARRRIHLHSVRERLRILVRDRGFLLHAGWASR